MVSAEAILLCAQYIVTGDKSTICCFRALQVCACNDTHPTTRSKKQGSEFHSGLEQRSSQLQKQSVWMSVRIRAVEYIRCAPVMTHTFRAGKHILSF